MRVVIVGTDVVKIFFRILHGVHPDWDVINMGDVAHQQFIAELPALEADCVLIADDLQVIYGLFSFGEHGVPLPSIAVFGYFTPSAAHRLRSVSAYPIPAPCSMDELLDLIDTQVPLLRDEIASPDRAKLARTAADKLFLKR